MDAYEILQCLEAVSQYEKGEGENIIQYENEFLLSNEDIKVLLKYIKNLQSKIGNANEYIDKEIKKIQQHEYARGIRRLRKLEEILKEEK